MGRNLGRALVAALAVLAASCGPSQEDIANGKDPLRALESTANSKVYDAEYWAEQAHSGSPIWTDAIEKCKDAKLQDLPNCTLVREEQAAAEAEGTEDQVGSDNHEEVVPEDSASDGKGGDAASEDKPDAEGTPPGEEPSGADGPDDDGPLQKKGKREGT